MIGNGTRACLEIAKVAIDKAIVQHMLDNPSLKDIRYAKLPEQEIHNLETSMLNKMIFDIDALLKS